LLAISVDPVPRSRALAEELRLPFPLLADEDVTVTHAYGVFDEDNDVAWPAIFVVAPDGTVAWREVSESYKIRPPPPRILAALACDARAE
jgi:peroxiredoxin